MKVRILNNSFRFRLKEKELLLLQQKGLVTETVEFGASPSARLSFHLEITKAEDFKVCFEPNNITFSVPEQVKENWIQTNLTGFNAEIATSDEKKIRLLVEKDFRCMQVCAEENAGSFPEPAGSIK